MSAKKRGRPIDPDSLRSKGASRFAGPRVGFRISPWLLKIFKQRARKNRRSLSQEIIVAMETILRADGVEIPADQKD
jgi:hypothetical protein